jgi:Flp pilus assembly protein TadD
VPSRSQLAARLVLAAVAVALGAVGLERLDGDRACTAAAGRAYAVGLGTVPPSAAPAIAAAVRAHCAGTPLVAGSSFALLQASARGPARELAELAVAQAPEDHRAWIARAAVLAAEGDRAGARRARARARALNPRAPRRPAPDAAAPAPGR